MKTCPGIRFFGEILPGLGFALAAHPYLPLLGSRSPPPSPDFLSKKHVKNRHQQIDHTSRTADKKMNNEVDGGFRPIS